MFNTLTSYLLGNTNRSNTNTNNNYNNQGDITVGTAEPENLANYNLSTTICDEDDDWLLVVENKEEEDSLPRTDSEGELPLVKVKNSRRRRNRQHHHHHQQQQQQLRQQPHNDSLGERQRQLSSLPFPTSLSSMEESWFVTPPPCFTSTGPILLETSPLENLLIEHPSMSVYHSLRNSTRDMEEEEEDMVVLDFIMESVSNDTDDTASTQGPVRSPPRHRVYQIADINERQLKQELLNRNAQKHQVRKHRQIHCRNALDRLNKTREVNSKGGHQKRCDLQHAKSYSRVNNNRKC